LSRPELLVVPRRFARDCVKTTLEDARYSLWRNFPNVSPETASGILKELGMKFAQSRRFRNIRKKLPRILSDKTTSVIFLNSLVDSYKIPLLRVYRNMIEVFK
ncbi:hypothetical protein L9F63_024268, partial [Diploptera punctata]